MSRMKWRVLEWNALDNDVDLYEWESSKTDPAEVWEEVSEELHNFASVLVMDEERFQNFIGPSQNGVGFFIERTQDRG
jgi:hypothetical protein